MNLKENMVYCQERVNNYLKAYLDNLPEVALKLRDAMAYGVLLGGKRVRPFLVYNVAKSLGIDYDLADAPAAAIECIHAYSLIHDDLPAMDDDSLRRGHPTCHVKFGEATAILAGDALQTMAFEILGTAAEKFAARGLTANLVEMYKVLARGSGYAGMCGGQELDLEAEGLLVSQEALEKVHRHKTGALIESAVDLGLLLNPTLPQGTKEAYASYARGIGLAFQVWDDVLDIISDTETLGKPQGSDEAEEKSTYPRLMGLEVAKKYALDLANKAKDSLKATAHDTQVLCDFADFIVSRDH
ncbi:MAG: (2E,6E)-farnesyl diphosphate synthase [Succinivibrionaceae bacterium]|nr:(2E,6E)-farnesyl diphosphate synthase [Succinivibrionaceae bacterium]